MERFSAKAVTMEKSHEIKNIKFEDGFLIITIDGETKRFELKAVSPVLEKASSMERSYFEISPVWLWDKLAPAG